MKLTEQLNKYLANLEVANVKLHNLHWNVAGLSFKTIHEYLEMLYDENFERFDQVAEILKMQGSYPKASLKEYLEVSDIEELESDKDWSIRQSLDYAREYLEHMKKEALEIREAADSEDNFAVANLMEDHIEAYNKQIWFIDQSLKFEK